MDDLNEKIARKRHPELTVWPMGFPPFDTSWALAGPLLEELEEREGFEVAWARVYARRIYYDCEIKRAICLAWWEAFGDE